MLELAPPIISPVMGVYPPAFVGRMKAKGIKWFANISTVTEAKAAQDAGADVIVAQGMEAGGHRYAFDAATAEANMVGLFSLIPAVVDAVSIPVGRRRFKSVPASCAVRKQSCLRRGPMPSAGLCRSRPS